MPLGHWTIHWCHWQRWKSVFSPSSCRFHPLRAQRLWTLVDWLRCGEIISTGTCGVPADIAENAFCPVRACEMRCQRTTMQRLLYGRCRLRLFLPLSKSLEQSRHSLWRGYDLVDRWFLPRNGWCCLSRKKAVQLWRYAALAAAQLRGVVWESRFTADSFGRSR